MKKSSMLLLTAVMFFSLCGSAYALNLGLLVKNAGSLDAEELAAYNFATSKGFSVIAIDPAKVVSAPEILCECDGYWAANSSEPTGFNTPFITAQLRYQLEKQCKGLFLSWYGHYIAQYLGYGTAYTVGYYPAVSDQEFWVDKIDAYSVFDGFASWIPPVPPDDPTKSLWYSIPGSYPIGAVTVSWTASYTPIFHYYAHILATYGWCHQQVDPALCTQYGVSCTCERSVHRSGVPEVAVGKGAIIYGFNSVSGAGGADPWHFGPMGFQMVGNILTYVCQHRVNGSCDSDPCTISTQNRTWGNIKSLYR